MFFFYFQQVEVFVEKLFQNLNIEYKKEYEVKGKRIDFVLQSNNNLDILVEIKAVKNNCTNAMFEAYANIWASKSTEEYTKLLLIMDTHSPDKVRVNAVLSSIEEFYRLYNIIEDNQMYKSEEERIRVW